MADRLFPKQYAARAESLRGADDRAQVAGILNAGYSHQEQVIADLLDQILELGRLQLDQSGHALRRLGVDGAAEDVIGQQQHLRMAGNLGPEARGLGTGALAQENRLEAQAAADGFLDDPQAFNGDAALFGRLSLMEGLTKIFDQRVLPAADRA